MDAVEQKATYKMEMAQRNRSNMYKNLIDQRKLKEQGIN